MVGGDDDFARRVRQPDPRDFRRGFLQNLEYTPTFRGRRGGVADRTETGRNLKRAIPFVDRPIEFVADLKD